MGEVGALAVALNQLRRRLQPEGLSLRVLISVTTDAGLQTAKRLFQREIKEDQAKVYFLPLDHPSAINRALEAVAPVAFVFTETEIWPTLLGILSEQSIPHVLINARISPKSFARYCRVSGFIERALAGYELIVCQSEADAARFQALGASGEKLLVSGNLKMDSSLRPPGSEARKKLRLALGVDDDEFLLVAGSVRSAEIRGLIGSFQKLRSCHQNLRLAVAPRRLDNISAMQEIAAEAGLSSLLYSSLSATKSNNQEKSQPLILVDTFGALTDLYGAAELAFVGGTMTPIGGHNVLEPPQVGVAALFGPHTENVAEAVTMLESRDLGQTVQNWEEFADVVSAVINGSRVFAVWRDRESGPSQITINALLQSSLGAKLSSRNMAKATEA